jgi:ligand-binding SRPBCC domain-containing protein
MAEYILEREQWIVRPAADVFEFLSNAANLEKTTPPWLAFRIATPIPLQIRTGTRIEYEIRWRFFRMKWMSEIIDWPLDRRFTDVQVRGPYALWHHDHTFESDDGGTRMQDRVRFKIQLGPLGAIAHQVRVRRDLNSIFDYRAAEIERTFSRDNSS